MIVKTKKDIGPLCDEHPNQMELVRFEAEHFRQGFHVYLCPNSGCSRAYSQLLGYHDFLPDRGVNVDRKERSR